MNTLKVAAFMALKSLTRGDVRVLLLTVAMLVLVYINLIFTPSLLTGAVQKVNEKTRGTLSGDIIIHSDNYPVIVRAQEMVSSIENVDGVAAAAARTSLGVEVHHGDDRVAAALYAIDPDRDSRVFDISGSLIEGTYLDPDDRNAVLLGAQIAGAGRENLELYASSLMTVHAGDNVTIYAANGSMEFTVKGIFFTEFVQSDIRAYITQAQFDAMFPGMRDTATSIHVKLEPGADRSVVMARIREVGLTAYGQPLKFQTWEDALGVMKSMTKSFDQIIAILRTTALVVAGITIFIVTYVDLVNKRRQIGIERAIGITSASIVLSYIIRAVVYAAFGVVMAALIFRYAMMPIEAQHPFHFPFGDVLLVVDIPELASSAAILLAVAIVSAFIPAWQTIRTKIIDAIWSG
ncbi:MAG: ABC transporter permease [Dehalococcoidia bacterium]|nr:ABC transporter permease [Dehalococcoidia bacterium]